ncbi:uncharacterized protein BDZ83DRAFT_291071 [Colletotrichum acutatum]|uniref:Uncharacterized protein n=1 Tax=Glomerella acutata TaxID=27357 RepID=A0AAD8XP66_GLOAC|nr:uncharacterized protein BDZ83DRAFT_291071 [Colletotrichum acutatum]KAK1730966.1 hypothetical protein BDZ83DRAFT_291071 [Colletotrichum acutatum]
MPQEHPERGPTSTFRPTPFQQRSSANQAWAAMNGCSLERDFPIVMLRNLHDPPTTGRISCLPWSSGALSQESSHGVTTHVQLLPPESLGNMLLHVEAELRPHALVRIMTLRLHLSNSESRVGIQYHTFLAAHGLC